VKRADPEHEVVVYERNPHAAPMGWGVVFWDDLLADLPDAHVIVAAGGANRALRRLDSAHYGTDVGVGRVAIGAQLDHAEGTRAVRTSR